MAENKTFTNSRLHQSLIQYVYGIIGCMQYVHRQLGPGMPEYIYQEALCRKLVKEKFDARKEFIYHLKSARRADNVCFDSKFIPLCDL